ncbi:toxin HicA [Nostoc commune]|uniref:toxin HicA n=1 Tax=Nostoc commune TaxID=1178 RepID=UPI0018C49E98|nr:toxin HicA [Nostoc commune]MBG1259688.1 HopJ type III effector protein [Nostoc commune BAE]
MGQIEDLLAQIKNNPKNVRFADLMKVCNHYFGDPRQQGTSHCIYKTPWTGDPRVNIQEKNGKAKVYQVKQVIDAIEKLEEMKDG